MRSTLKSTLLAVLALLTLAPACYADGFSVGVGADYSSGKYGGTDRTTIASVPMNAKYVAGPLTLKLSVSWISVSGTGAIIPSGLGGIGGSGGESGGSGGTVGVFGCAADNRSGARKPEDNGPCATTTVVGAAAALRRTEQGFGDIVAAATYNALNLKGLSIDVTGRIKFATASDTKGLGSGKMDYAMQIEAEHSIGNGSLLSGHLSNRFNWLAKMISSGARAASVSN